MSSLPIPTLTVDNGVIGHECAFEKKAKSFRRSDIFYLGQTYELNSI